MKILSVSLVLIITVLSMSAQASQSHLTRKNIAAIACRADANYQQLNEADRSKVPSTIVSGYWLIIMDYIEECTSQKGCNKNPFPEEVSRNLAELVALHRLEIMSGNTRKAGYHFGQAKVIACEFLKL